jgi:hypothetical protein
MTQSYRDQFPDIADDRPDVLRVQFEGDPFATDRRVLATAPSLRTGDRLYVNMAAYGHAEEWVPAQILDVRPDLLVVKKSS